ncbi:MAG: ABC transporter permease [Clostridia bacterium]|nr:ABC transporter permease [Clostridia bacterium]
MLFAAQKFMDAWRKVPVFSTAMAALVMAAIMTYALGFHFETIGEWAAYWFNNSMNVLRANSSVGMIALGMTFVIISGGIDLAVGSTLAGVSTVIMCLIDVGQNGLLTNMGITGLPAYIIACVAGIAAGLAFGAITGGVITKGKVPPFIVTLGMMQIIRSVAQYFTKSYNPDVPKEFQALANTVIGGQMLLPILYWLVLAVILHIVSRHTAFGRHVYAVGSNERTTMLSGINVDKVKMKVYVLMGFIVALASIAQVARLRGVDVASAGNGYEMNAIAAVVVGGTSMAGGKGSILGTVLGVLIIGIMNNLLVLLSVDSFLSAAFTGAIVIAAVLMQRKEKNA